MAEKRPNKHGLARALSKLGVCSRTEAARLIAAGRVTVGGRVERDPDRRTDPGREPIAVDGAPVHAAEPVVLVMHKPVGLITTRRDPDGRPTVFSILPPDLDAHLAPVGRLDADTSGLLLFTNDTRLADGLASGDGRVEKRYEATVRGRVGEAALARLRAGLTIDLPGQRSHATRPAGCEVLASEGAATRLALTLTEGKNRQVRRMLAAVGHEVVALRRTRIGPLDLGDLPEGAVRRLAPGEVAALRRCVRPAR